MSEATARTVIDLRQQSAAGATGAQAGETSPSTPPRARRAAAEPKAAAVPSATGRSAFLPVLLGLSALLAAFAFQTRQLVRGQQALKAARANQQAGCGRRRQAALGARLAVTAQVVRTCDNGSITRRPLASCCSANESA